MKVHYSPNPLMKYNAHFIDLFVTSQQSLLVLLDLQQ